MSEPLVSPADACIAVLASFGSDGRTLARIVEHSGACAAICSSAEDLEAVFGEQIAAILVTEESLPDNADAIKSCLETQPSWSDVPVIILSGRGESGTMARWRFLRQFGNVTVLARPLSSEALGIALEAARRARAWQYVVRDQMQRLEALNVDLEQKVLARTRELHAETDERKRIEAALNEARRLEAIGRLAGGVAHDFNNLLQVISGACDLLPFVKDTPRFEPLVATIRRATERGSRLTQQMLAFGRRQVLSSDALDIAQHVIEMKELLQQSLREKIVLELELQDDLWHARADVTQLEIALLNLVVNAKDVLPNGGVVTLTARNISLPSSQISEVNDLAGDFVWLSVSDSGPGMPPDVAAQAFEPFFTTKRIGEGSGLGLSQVYGFAKQSGGSAWIRSSARGTSVSILLPRSSVDGSRTPNAAHQAADAHRARGLQGLRVLCVEDDESVGEMTVALLESMGCVATWARSAGEALRLDLDDYDIVFSDVQMPGGMDGVAMAREIALRRPALPVVLASGFVLAPERLQELRATVISKPYDAQTLRAALLDRLD